MAEPLVLTERRPDAVALVRLHRPPMNPLSNALLGELASTAADLGADPEVKAVVVTGSERAFAAGADVDEFDGPHAARRVAHAFRHALDAVEAIPRPVLAAVSGYALGGGCELAMACDLRVAGEDARFGQPEVLLGLLPGGGGTQRLPRLVGPARAKELIWSGRQVDATEAVAIGLVDRVVPTGEVVDATLTWAAELASGPVVAMGLAKRAIHRGLDGSLAAGLDVEAECWVEAFETDDARHGIASFLEQGPGRATFSGR